MEYIKEKTTNESAGTERLKKELQELFRRENDEYVAATPMSHCEHNTPQLIRDQLRHMKRDMIHLWEFICQEGLADEAREYIADHRSEEAVFEWYMIEVI